METKVCEVPSNLIRKNWTKLEKKWFNSLQSSISLCITTQFVPKRCLNLIIFFIHSRQQLCPGQRSSSWWLSDRLLFRWLLWAHWVCPRADYAKGVSRKAYGRNHSRTQDKSSLILIQNTQLGAPASFCMVRKRSRKQWTKSMPPWNRETNSKLTSNSIKRMVSQHSWLLLS